MNREQRSVLTDTRRAAMRELAQGMAELVASRPEGYPAGELWAAVMPMCPRLETFESLMRLAVLLKLVEKRGQVYYGVRGDE